MQTVVTFRYTLKINHLRVFNKSTYNIYSNKSHIIRNETYNVSQVNNPKNKSIYNQCHFNYLQLLQPSQVVLNLSENKTIIFNKIIKQFSNNCHKQYFSSFIKSFQEFNIYWKECVSKLFPRWRSTFRLCTFLTPSVIFNNKGHETQSKDFKPLIIIPPEPKKDELHKRKHWLIKLLYYAYELFRLLLRTVRLALTFGPIFILSPITYLGSYPNQLWWWLMLHAVELSGPIFIKLGQWISTRRDLFPDTCCQQFSKLQRSAKPHSWNFTKYRLRQAFGPHWRRVFIKFDNNKDPVGSGCVAQAYKVWMNKDAIPDQTIVEEIISEMDDEPTTLDLYDGLEILGLGRLFSWRKDKEIQEDEEALKDWQQDRMNKLQSNMSAPCVGDEGPDNITDVVTEVASIISPAVESTPSQSVQDINETDEIQHALVEAWDNSQEKLEKSLPFDNMPPDDIDGLVPVAVKVLHPGVQSTCRRDIRIMRLCASIITFLIPPLKWLDLPFCIDEFGATMLRQVDLRLEARNLERFFDNFADIDTVRFPRPVRPFVTSKVMAETYEEGENMLDYTSSTAGQDKPEELKKHLAKLGIDALLKMIFVDNLIHGDLHPGNILVQNVGVPQGDCKSGNNPTVMMIDVGCDTFVMDVQPDPKPLRICLLDCGVVSSLSKTNLASIKAVFQHIVLGNAESVAELFLKESRHQCQDTELFISEMSELVDLARDKTVSLNEVDVGILLQQVMNVLRKHKIHLESAFSSVVLAVFVLEGLGRSLDKDMNVLERARPVLLTGQVF